MQPVYKSTAHWADWVEFWGGIQLLLASLLALDLRWVWCSPSWEVGICTTWGLLVSMWETFKPVKKFCEFIWAKVSTIAGKQDLSRLRKYSRERRFCTLFYASQSKEETEVGYMNSIGGEGKGGDFWDWTESKMIDTHFIYWGGYRTVNSQQFTQQWGDLWSPQSDACALRVWKKGNYFDIPMICYRCKKIIDRFS